VVFKEQSSVERKAANHEEEIWPPNFHRSPACTSAAQPSVISELIGRSEISSSYRRWQEFLTLRSGGRVGGGYQWSIFESQSGNLASNLTSLASMLSPVLLHA
jgi:hypothetical protein